MNEGTGGITLSQLAVFVGVAGPIVTGLWVLFKTVSSIIKAEVEKESLQRHAMGKLMTQNFGMLEQRTSVLERDGATRKDLDNAEQRIKSDIGEVKTDVRDMRGTTQNILQEIAAMGALLSRGKRPIVDRPLIGEAD